MSVPVVVLGDALIDELRDDHGLREFVGGAALNVAVGLRVLGVPATLLAAIDDDPAAARILEYLRAYDVELTPTAVTTGTGRAVSTRSGTGEPRYSFNETATLPRITAGIGAPDWADTAVILSGIPFDDAAQVEILTAPIAAAHAVILDPNPRAARLRDAGDFRAGFERLARGANLVKIGDDDVRLLGYRDMDDARAVLQGLGVGAVLSTHGADGARIDAGDVTVSAPISRLPGRIIDTMGAGDATLSTVVTGLLTDPPSDAAGWQSLLDRAMDVAAATCRAEGALLRVPRQTADDADRIGT